MLTSGSEYDLCPTWSPDGNQIAFERSIYDKKDNNMQLKSWAICIVDTNGSNIETLVKQPAQKGPSWGMVPAWSPDGKEIAYCCWAVDRPSVWVMDADGGNQRMLHSWGGDAGIDWSPDSSKIIFGSYQDSWNNWRSNDLYVINADGMNMKRLTQPGPPLYLSPVWSPDGKNIAFCMDPNGGQNDDLNFNIYLMDADGSNVQQITNTPTSEFFVDWTASSYAIESAGMLKNTWGKIKQGLFSP